jgi:hypothetical protein
MHMIDSMTVIRLLLLTDPAVVVAMLTITKLVEG